MDSLSRGHRGLPAPLTLARVVSGSAMAASLGISAGSRVPPQPSGEEQGLCYARSALPIPF